ncbi:phosphopantetheine-binding protein [Ensifer sp. BR816]|uniref:phosphopantetheine-binding protein n=1 Tax=Rhizobium sp. (strain BR816) TaxID=1057002 RepID=UPI000379C5EE|nr:phosphopantetheine-binding protein [Ensifer sp. BR816]
MTETAFDEPPEWGDAERSVFLQVRAFVADAADVPLERVTPEVNLFDDLGIDSLGLLLILINLEETYGLKVPGNLEELGPQLSTPSSIVIFALDAAASKGADE